MADLTPSQTFPGLHIVATRARGSYVCACGQSRTARGTSDVLAMTEEWTAHLEQCRGIVRRRQAKAVSEQVPEQGSAPPPAPEPEPIPDNLVPISPAARAQRRKKKARGAVTKAPEKLADVVSLF